MPGLQIEDEDERLAAIRALNLFNTAPEERFDRVVRLAQHIFNVPYVAINLVGEHEHFTKAAAGDLFGAPMSTLPREESLCSVAIESDRTLEITDIRSDERFTDHPLRDNAELGYYAGAPLRTPGGQRVGSLCLIDNDSRRALSVGEQAMLRDLASWVERELATGADLEQGSEVQRRLLPRSIPDLPGWEVAGRCVQAGAVGGDFYDWLVLERSGNVQVALADVMGKGLQAALLAAGVRAILRGTSPHNSLAASIRRVADDMVGDLDELGSFVTFFAARFRPEDGAVEYVDAGHGLAFIIGPDREVHLESEGLPIGALPDEQWEIHEDRVGPGEALVIVSDGFLDVHGDHGTVMDVIQEALGRTEGADALAAELARGALGKATTDDVTVVVVRRSAA
ncbi:PP2C family protein-serine/threonine phosphatase [Nocardioides stalactiti]|uniref:PP2C family protein-serine/threonine phosphatase n=1 Tax=Nocardioides stalactiti TaxID=2755356 RepID=UPI0015FEFD8A|nr:SpoIIE family protein phosphatase [Nocardioides stalactiti]